jgi:HPt (histidine-containing phosphotransfer) domain-containing protein
MNGDHGLGFTIDADTLDLIPEFLEARTTDAVSIEQELAIKSYATIVRIAHCIKGGGGCYGFPMITAIGVELERGAQTQDNSTIVQSVARLRNYLAEVRQALASEHPNTVTTVRPQ